MKKIIIAALVAAAAADAYCGACSPQPVKETAWAYTWKFTGKTTTGKSAPSFASGSACAPGKPAGCAYRTPCSLKIQGYTYACSPSACADDALGFETQFAECSEVFYMTKPYKASFFGGVAVEIAHIIGKNMKRAEIQGAARFTDDVENADFDLVFAGLGKYNLGSGRLTSASGCFAGTLSQPWAVLPKKGVCVQAGYWRCDTLDLVCEGPSVAYGKWQVKYNSTASKKYLKGVKVKLPAWVKERNS